MKFTFTEYTQNPMGKTNAVFTHRETYRKLYQEKLDKILLREVGKIDYRLLKDSKQGKFYIYIKIPSEVVPKFYYDVVVEFYPDGTKSDLSPTLEHYAVRFFSNDPAFVFTFAHAFKQNDVFITELAAKMSKRALKERADQKNPKDVVGYVKSLYFAYLYIKAKGLFSKVQFKIYGTEINFKQLIQEIEHADSKIERRQELGAEEEKKKKTPPKDYREKPDNLTKNSKSTNRLKPTNIVKSVNKTSRIKTTKKS